MMPIAENTPLVCWSCGKTMSRNQAIYYSGKNWCLDSILNLLGGNLETEGERVSISVDLLQRMRDGIV